MAGNDTGVPPRLAGSRYRQPRLPYPIERAQRPILRSKNMHQAHPVSTPEVEIVTAPEEFLALHDDWKALATRDPRASIFVQHEWVDAAWAWKAHESTPLILLVRQEGTLKGIVPLVREKKPRGQARLGWLSIPDNQEVDVVCAPDDRETVLEAFADWLAMRSHWSRLSLSQLAHDSVTRSALLATLRARGIHAVERDSDLNPCIDLTTGWETFYRGRSRRLKKGNNLIANRLERAGTVRVVRLTGHDIAPAIADTLRRLSAASWKQDTATTFDHPGPSAFLDTLIEHGRREGWLVVWLLTLDGRPIASEIHLEYGGRAHALRADYAEDAAELSPGSFLNWKIIESLFDSELHRYELGPGTNPYKQRWTEDALPLSAIEAWPATAVGRMQAMWHLRLRPLLARVKRGAQAIFGR